MLVRHFMTRRVITVHESLRCRAALRLMRDNGIRRAPVLRGEKLVGMLSERDLLRILPGTVGELDTRHGQENESSIVSQVMATRLVTLHPEEHLEDAARKMLAHKIGGMPVVLGARLEGILTESDIFRAMVKMTNPEDELRVTFARTTRDTAPLDPILVALRLGFLVRGYLVHERPGGEELTLMRLRGTKKRELTEALNTAGYTVIEVADTQAGSSERPAA